MSEISVEILTEEDESLTVVVDLDEAFGREDMELESKRCDECKQIFPSTPSLLHHKEDHAEVEVSDEKVRDAWERSGGRRDIPELLLDYLKSSIAKHGTGSELMKSFSLDGLSIPDLCPDIPRTKILLTVLKALNILRECNNSTQKVNSVKSTYLTEDEIHILQYIGGYIIHKMKKESKLPEEYCSLCRLVSTAAFASPPSSLISIMQNNDFGKLTTPIPQLTSVLQSVEVEFRKKHDNAKILLSVFERLDFNRLGIVLQDRIALDVLEKICRYYLRIRCFQKAQVLNSKHLHKKDQNLGHRKKLKGLSK